MQQGLLIVILLAFLVASCSSSAHSHSRMLQLMSSTSELQRDNPTRSMACFQYYGGEFDKHLQQYEYEYGLCKDQATKQTADLYDKYNQVVYSLGNTTLDVCKSLTDCTYQANALDSLNCYSDQGSESVRNAYNLSSTASLYSADLTQDIQQVKFSEDGCTNSSTRRYEARVDQTYIDLQNCLSGAIPVPDPTPATTTTTTAAPATSDSTWIPKTTDRTTTQEDISSSWYHQATAKDDGTGTSSSGKNHGLASKIGDIIKHIV